MKLIDLFEKQKLSKTVTEVRLKAMHISNYKINSDMSVDIAGDVNIPNIFSEIPVQFGSISGAFSCAYVNALTSLEGAPSYVRDSFSCTYTHITSLHNVHKIIKYIGNVFRLSSTIKSHVLGVMFIKGLKEIVFDMNHNAKQFEVAAIINKHLKGNRNPHECQEELVDAGLSEYAKL